WVAGAKLRVRLALIRGRNAARNVDAIASPAAPAALNIAMAFGVTFAALGGGSAIALSATHPPAHGVDVVFLRAAPSAPMSQGGAFDRVAPAAPDPAPPQSPLIRKSAVPGRPVRGHVYDDKSKTTDIWIGFKKYGVEFKNWRGPDGLWALYRTEDT